LFRSTLSFVRDIQVDLHLAVHDNRARSHPHPRGGIHILVAKLLESVEDMMLPKPRNAVCLVFFVSTLCSLLLILCVTSLAHAQTGNLVGSPVDSRSHVLLKGHHPLWANQKNDLGAVPSDLPIEHITIVLNHSAEQQQAFDQFLGDQQNPASPDYHHWLTPAQIGKRFGVSAHDMHAVTVWLKSQNLHVDSISNSRQRITCSGPASAVASAFATEMHYFTVNGEKRISINAEPQIPSALAGVINSVSGLYTVRLYPLHESEIVQRRSRNVDSNFGGVQPEGSGYVCNGIPACNVIFPADFAVIYDVNAVAGGINGTGQTIAIIGRSAVCTTDIMNFASAAALTANIPNVIVPPLGITPQPPMCTGTASEDQGEATLDVTRSGSVAQGANLDLVVSADTATTDGIQIAVTYVVDTPPTPAPKIMSISFGSCETPGSKLEVQYWDGLFKQAAAQGMSVFVSSGDSAAAGCDVAFTTPPAIQTLNPNALCSSSYVTCVGGTEFADFANPNQYWNQANNGTGFESALSYIPEGAWNEPLNAHGNVQVAGTGGGFSQFIATPSWQVGTGVPMARAGRYTPDVAFSASIHDGYFACLAASNKCTGNGSFVLFAGTSAAAPDMAGIAALLNQQEASAQGLLNPNLYALAATPANGVFNDVTVASSGVTGCVLTTPSMCNNSTAGMAGLTGGLSGYLVTAGYDEATGLGSINVASLLRNWVSSVAPTTTTLNITPASPLNFGTSVTLTATVKPASTSSKTPTGTATFTDAVRGTLGSGTLNSSGVATLTSTRLAGASYSITANYSGDTNFSASTSSAVPYDVRDFRFTPNPPPVTVTAPGQKGTTTLIVTPLGGFNQTLTYSCTSGLPSEATCTFAVSSATSETLTIATTAPSSRLDKSPLQHRTGLFYALLLPGLLGLVLSTRKRGSRGARVVSLIAVLALSPWWMSACGGGSSSTPGNPGTPTGTSIVTVSATTGGTVALTHTVSVTLSLQ
jgi:subtilase family serine protease